MDTLQCLCDTAGFPVEYTDLLEKTVAAMGAPLLEAVDAYLADPRIRTTQAVEALAPVAEAAGVHAYALNAAFVALGFLKQKDSFIAECGEDVYYGAVKDLFWKMRECHGHYGILGSSSIDWHNLLLRKSILTLGRLQFHTVPLHLDAIEIGRISLKKGDLMVKIHIPSSGKLTGEDCLDSYRLAHRYFRPRFQSDTIPFFCSSWLLDPALSAAIPDGGIAAFASHFTVFEAKDDPTNHDLWRIFGTEPTDLTTLPRNSRLQAFAADRLASGRCLGIGSGIFLHDGESIIK